VLPCATKITVDVEQIKWFMLLCFHVLDVTFNTCLHPPADVLNSRYSPLLISYTVLWLSNLTQVYWKTVAG